MSENITQNDAHATLHAETLQHDQERIVTDAATDAGSECAWAIMTKPSQRLSLSLAEKREMGLRARELVNQYQELAEADPKTFTREFFKALESAMSDYAWDLKQEGVFK